MNDQGRQNAPIRVKDMWRKFYTKRQLLFVLFLFALSCWGIYDSFRDASGERIFGALPVILPGILAIWQTLFILKIRKEELKTPVFIRWFYFTACLGSLPLIAANCLFTLIAWLIPANRIFIEQVNHHYYWEGAIGFQFLMIGCMGFIFQLLGSLLILIIIILPVLSRRKADIVTEGSILEKVEDAGQRKKLSISIYTSLAMLVVGFILEISTIGIFLEVDRYKLSLLANRIWVESQWVISELLYGIYNLEQIIWLLGIILIVIGILSLIWDVFQIKKVSKKNKRR